MLDDLTAVVALALTPPVSEPRGAGAGSTTSACRRCVWCAVMVISPSCGSPAPAVPVLGTEQRPAAPPTVDWVLVRWPKCRQLRMGLPAATSPCRQRSAPDLVSSNERAG
jgi:hypothetical protein